MPGDRSLDVISPTFSLGTGPLDEQWRTRKNVPRCPETDLPTLQHGARKRTESATSISAGGYYRGCHPIRKAPLPTPRHP